MKATFMTALHIHHVRHLKDIHIPLSQEQRKPLILTGKNGSGKTSVLMALERFLEYAVSSNFDTKEKCQSFVAYFEKEIARLNKTEEEKIEAEQQRKNLAVWKKDLKYWTDGAVAECTSYADLRAKYQNGSYVLAYYGDHRKIEVDVSNGIEKVDLKNVYTLKEYPSRKLVKYMASLKATEALAQTHGKPQRATEINEWFLRFIRVLRSVYEEDDLELDFNIETYEFTILQKNHEPFEFNTMSMGYAAIFAIIGDLMMRMEAHRRYDLEGLVLIDEIETHLHVSLQKKIVPILMELFPNIQFVLTTHSPFILNSTPNAVVYDLENATLVTDGLTNLPYEGIVEGYFGADLLSRELRQKFEEYRALVKKTDLTDADFARAAELELYLDEVPDYLALNFSAEYGRLKLELSGRG